jgi:putative Mn2+ efflux pump MntP
LVLSAGAAIDTLLTAIALAMDAVAVSIAAGVAVRRPSWAQSLRMGAAFGIFQPLMPLLGFALVRCSRAHSKPGTIGSPSRCWLCWARE